MIYKYLSEIKYRIFFSIIAWFFTMIVCYCFKETLLFLVIKPSLSFAKNNSFFFLTTNIAEVFMAYLQLCYFISNQIIILFLLYHIFIFIANGLYISEYLYLKAFILICISSFFFLIVSFNNFIFPTSWFFFLKFQTVSVFEGLIFYFEIKLNEYINFYVSTYFICCSAYLLVLLFYIFLSTFKISLFVFKSVRKILYFIFCTFASLITPPEIVYQLIISICIIIIYEILVFYAVLKIKSNKIKSVTN